VYISPTEPAPIKALGRVSGIPERYGCDILIVNGRQQTGVQRKQFPGDLLASLRDGRLNEQLGKMTVLDRAVLILEGHGQWTMDGELIDQQRFTKGQLFGIIYSLAFEFGVEVLWVGSMRETAEAVVELNRWCQKDKHMSLARRPGPQGDGWGKRSAQAWGMHLLQGFPGIGPELAGRIIEHFGGIPLRWSVDEKGLQAVPGVGKGKAGKLWGMLDG
jgi:DNA excision repair protein ERCC-4